MATPNMAKRHWARNRPLSRVYPTWDLGVWYIDERVFKQITDNHNFRRPNRMLGPGFRAESATGGQAADKCAPPQVGTLVGIAIHWRYIPSSISLSYRWTCPLRASPLLFSPSPCVLFLIMLLLFLTDDLLSYASVSFSLPFYLFFYCRFS